MQTKYAKCFFIKIMSAVAEIQMYFTVVKPQLLKLRTSNQFKDNLCIL